MTTTHPPAVVRIANASGFYGDRFSAWREMLDGGHLDVLTGDYLAELTMFILGRDRSRDAGSGYAKTFLRQMEQSLGTALERGVRLVSNAGGLNPGALADALRRLGLPAKIGVVTGDDVTDRYPGALTANAYLGAFGVAACLRAGADIVVTGRITDASLVVGPAAAHFGWSPGDLDALAGATVAGHVIECGAQATGGNFAYFTRLPDGGRRPGFPIAEIRADGSAVITKHPGTGGAVTTGTLTAQLVYEIGAPAYLGPDVVSHFETIRLTDAGPDRVLIDGVRGTPPPSTAKVGVSTLAGYRNAMTFVLCGLDIEAKAALVRAQLEDTVGKPGLEFILGRTDHPDADTEEAASALLHVHLTDTDARRAGRSFAQAAVELVLASYPGCTLTGPPGDAVPVGVFTAGSLPQSEVPHIAVLPSGERVDIAPSPMIGTTSGTVWPSGRSETTPVTLSGSTRRVPLGTVAGARSGDKGGDANIGVWANADTAAGATADATFEWLRGFLTAGRLRSLLPETANLEIDRYELPNLRALNFVVRGLLGRGVAASTRFDPQAKALGEWLRCRLVDVPGELL